MLNQSFSAENFRKIFDIENRKGVNLDVFFPKTRKFTEKIKSCNEEIRKAKRLKKTKDEIKKLYEQKAGFRKKRETELDKELEKVSKKCLEKNFRIKLNQVLIPSKKTLYTVQDLPKYYFAVKQIQHNLSRLYKVKQSDRSAIMSNFLTLLNDGFPKVVIRTDISECYESIPHEKLLKKIDEDGLLAFFSKKIIKQLLFDYKKAAKSKKGVPRGIGVSASLSEIYLRKIDMEIKNIPGLIYYARYVDDIVAIFCPSNGETEDEYGQSKLKLVKESIKSAGLKVNTKKTKCFHLLENDYETVDIDYLGYAIELKSGDLTISLTKNKIDKYKKKIDLIFDAYKFNKINDEKSARKIFVKRVRFITGNTRLKNNKKNILVGIYYSNKHLSSLKSLKILDEYLERKVSTLPDTLKDRIKDYKFSTGFETRRFSPFTSTQLKNIVSIF